MLPQILITLKGSRSYLRSRAVREDTALPHASASRARVEQNNQNTGQLKNHHAQRLSVATPVLQFVLGSFKFHFVDPLLFMNVYAEIW
jgi:hypothetical protein